MDHELTDTMITVVSWVLWAGAITIVFLAVGSACITMLGLWMAKKNNIPVHWRWWPMGIHFDGVTQDGQRIQFDTGWGRANIVTSKDASPPK